MNYFKLLVITYLVSMSYHSYCQNNEFMPDHLTGLWYKVNDNSNLLVYKKKVNNTKNRITLNILEDGHLVFGSTFKSKPRKPKRWCGNDMRPKSPPKKAYYLDDYEHILKTFSSPRTKLSTTEYSILKLNSNTLILARVKRQ